MLYRRMWTVKLRGYRLSCGEDGVAGQCGIKYAGCCRYAAVAVNNYAQRMLWLAVSGVKTGCELRVVGNDGAGTDQNCVSAIAQFVAVGARRRAGNPLRVAVARRDFAIEAGRKLCGQIWKLLRHELEEWLIELTRFFFAEADVRWNAGCAQHGGAASVNQRIGVGDCGVDRGHAGRE